MPDRRIPPPTIPAAFNPPPTLRPMPSHEPPAPVRSEVIEVEIDGAVVEFPASMSEAQITAAIEDIRGQRPDPSLLERVVPAAMRVGGAISGAVLGSIAGPPGVIAGGAAGSGLGEYGAEQFETMTGQRTAINPTQVATQTALGAIPLGRVPGASATAEEIARFAARLPLRRTGQGAVLGGASAAATELAETGELPSVSRLAVPAAFGAVLGGVGGRVERAPMNARTARLAAEEAAARAPRAALPPGPAYQVTADGRVVPFGADVPPVQQPDPSFVRSVPAEYARREVRGALPPPRGFVAPESGPAQSVVDAGPVVTGRGQVIDFTPVQVRESSVRSVPAAVVEREFEGRRLVPRVFSSDPNATDAPLLPDLSPEVQHALRWLRTELDEIRFTRHTFNPVPRGRGGDVEIVPGTAGTAILGRIGANREDAIRAIDNLAKGKRTPVTDRVLEVAQGLAGGNQRLRRLMTLPPSAGDPPPAIADDVADVLPTGETQPRLPEAGQVRDVDQVTPEVADAPFSLASQAATNRGAQPGLFGGGLPPSDAGFERFADEVDDLSRAGGPSEPGEAGRISAMLAARLGLGGAGAAYGAASGEDTEDRIQRAVLFGGLGAAAPSVLARSKPVLQAAKTAADLPPVQTVRPVRGRPRVPAGDIPAEKLLSFKTIAKMPRQVRGEIANLLAKHGGFADQRRGVQSFARTQALADRIDVPLDPLVKGQALSAEELSAYRNAVASVFTERQPLAEKVAKGTASDADKVLFSQLTDTATTLLASLRGATAEAGRALGALRMKARVLEYGDAAFIRQALEAPGFEKDLQRIAKAATDAGGDPLKQLQALRAATSQSTFDRVSSVYYQGLLSGVKTHLRNGIANSFNLLANLTVPIAAAPIDLVRATVRGGSRQVTLGEIPRAAVATATAMPQAFQDAFFTLRHGFSPRAVAAAGAGKFDIPRAELPGGLITNLPSRALESADVFFRSLAYQQELTAAAYTAARNQGISRPQALAQRMAELMTGAGPEAEALRQQAEKFAARAVFQEDVGPFVEKLIAMKNDPQVPIGFRAAMTFIAPFLKTPANVLRQGAEFSPAGFLMSATQQGGREGAQAVGRAALGSMLLVPIAYLAATGRLSGSGPTQAGERAAAMEKGWRRNSIKVGDRWIEYNLAQPVGVAMSAVANAWERFAQSDRSDAAAEESFIAALSGAAASFLDQSFLAGVSGVLDAVQDPDRSAGRVLSQLAQGAVPASGLMRNVTQGVDPVVRQPEGAKEAVQSIVPGQSEKVLPRLDRFGRVVTRPGGVLRRGFLVPGVSEEVNDSVAQFLERLQLTPQLPRAVLVERGKQIPLTRDQEFVIRQALGQERYARLSRLLAHSGGEVRNEDRMRRVVQNLLADSTEIVNRKAKARLRRGEPLTLEALLTKGDAHVRQAEAR